MPVPRKKPTTLAPLRFQSTRQSHLMLERILESGVSRWPTCFPSPRVIGIDIDPALFESQPPDNCLLCGIGL